MVTPRTDPPRGVLHTAAVPPPGALGRYLPSDPALTGIVEHYWSLGGAFRSRCSGKCSHIRRCMSRWRRDAPPYTAW